MLCNMHVPFTTEHDCRLSTLKISFCSLFWAWIVASHRPCLHWRRIDGVNADQVPGVVAWTVIGNNRADRPQAPASVRPRWLLVQPPCSRHITLYQYWCTNFFARWAVDSASPELPASRRPALKDPRNPTRMKTCLACPRRPWCASLAGDEATLPGPAIAHTTTQWRHSTMLTVRTMQVWMLRSTPRRYIAPDAICRWQALSAHANRLVPTDRCACESTERH